MRTRRYPWMILASGIKNRKPITHYYPVVTFAREVTEEDAKTVAAFMKSKWPSYKWMATNRTDWMACFNSGPGAKAVWVPKSGYKRQDELTAEDKAAIEALAQPKPNC